LHRELGVSSGQCAEAAATIGFLVKSWLEQTPLLSPEAPVGAEATVAVEATPGTTEAKKGGATVGAVASSNAETANVPEDLELPIPARPPPSQAPSETVQAQVGELNAPVVVVVGPDRPEVTAQSTTSVRSSVTGPSLMLLLSGDAAISGTGTFPSAGVVPAIELGIGPHWSVGLAARFSSASSVNIASVPLPVSVSLSRTSGAVLGGYQFFPFSEWGLELLAGPSVEYWSTGGQTTGSLWQVAADVAVRGSWRFARAWSLFVSAETEVFFQRALLEVDAPTGVVSTTTPVLWFSGGLGLSYVFF
jgi:hypothetical protein